MAITRYAQIGFEQRPFMNFPGGGPILMGGTTPFGAAQFNDASLEIGDCREVTAIYQMYGNESASDVINLFLVQPGEMVTPIGTVSGSGIATTATITIGDDDTTGFGVVTGTAGLPLGASATRYASGINVATGQTNPIAFAGGDSLTNPYFIGATATEPQGGPTGSGVAGAWVQATFSTLGTPVAGKVLVFRFRLIKP